MQSSSSRELASAIDLPAEAHTFVSTTMLSTCKLHMPSIYCCFHHIVQITGYITEEIVGPIGYLPEPVHQHFLCYQSFWQWIAEVGFDVFVSGKVGLALGNAPLQSPQQMLAVSLDNELQIARRRHMQNQIRQRRLSGWMQMQLRLFEQQNRPCRRGEEKGSILGELGRRRSRHQAARKSDH